MNLARRLFCMAGSVRQGVFGDVECIGFGVDCVGEGFELACGSCFGGRAPDGLGVVVQFYGVGRVPDFGDAAGDAFVGDESGAAEEVDGVLRRGGLVEGVVLWPESKNRGKITASPPTLLLFPTPTPNPHLHHRSRSPSPLPLSLPQP